MAKQKRIPCLNCGRFNPNSKHVKYCSDSCYMNHYKSGEHNKPVDVDAPALDLSFDDGKKMRIETILMRQARRKVFWLRMIQGKQMEEMKNVLRQYVGEYMDTEKYKMMKINLTNQIEEVVDNVLKHLISKVKKNPELAILDVEYLHESVMNIIHNKSMEAAENVKTGEHFVRRLG